MDERVFNIRGCLDKLESLSVTSDAKYHVMGALLNPHIGTQSVNSNTPYGGWIPLGSYKNIDDAVQRRDQVSAFTGMPSVLILETNEMEIYTRGGRPDAVLYMRDPRKKESDLQNDLREAFRQKIEKDRKLIDEIEKRKDPETLEAFIQSIYQYTMAKGRMEEYKRLTIETEKIREQKREAVKNYILRNPKAAKEWRRFYGPTARERSEDLDYNLMTAAFHVMLEEFINEDKTDFFREIKRDLLPDVEISPANICQSSNENDEGSSSSKPCTSLASENGVDYISALNDAIQQLSDSDEDEKEFITCRASDRLSCPIPEISQSSSSSSKVQKWNEVLIGKVSLDQFPKDPSPTESPDEGWIKVGQRGSTNRGGKSFRGQSNTSSPIQRGKNIRERRSRVRR